MMIFRQATPTDTKTLIDFQQRMAMETEKMVLPTLTLAEGIQQIFSCPEKGTYYVATVDNNMIGCLLTLYEWSEWRNGNVVWIHSVYVCEPWRNKGVYKFMYQHIQQKVSRDSFLRGIRLYVDIANKKAQKVYESLGMDGEHYRLYEWMKPT